MSIGAAEPVVISTPAKRISPVFYLPDGRLAWSILEQDNQSSTDINRIEILSPQGASSTLQTIPGYVDRVLPSPDGNGLHRVRGAGEFIQSAEDLFYLSIAAGPEKEISPVTSLGRFAISRDGKRLYIGDQRRDISGKCSRLPATVGR
jgi:hypothetical protein